MLDPEHRTKPELVDSFSRRELQILEFLAQDYTNQEIAIQLSLAVNSVKWYLQQIFGKLSVKNRREAIRRAHEYGLLSEQPRAQQTFQPPLHNLPTSLTTFVGRQKDIAEIRRLFTQSGARLVTLTGTGGVGKTRLAIRASENILWEFNDGVWMVDLAPLGDAALLSQAVAAVFGYRAGQDSTIEEVLISNLRAKKGILVLDNCEHLVEACARLVEKLLLACPNLGVLASSREGLGIPGEVIYTVTSLSSPAADWQPGGEDLLQYDAVRLFVERAQTVLPAFALTPDNARYIVQICRRLDGIPLAIELAAARVKLLPVDQLMARLENNFRLLAGGNRTALPRHQTVHASIDWSFAMLAQPEHTLLRRLSVFRGGWTLAAAETVAESFPPDPDRPGGTDSERYEILDGLAQLINKSLVVIQHQADREPRYHMVETVRQYSFEKLVEAGETTLARDRHLAYFIQLCEALEPVLRSARRRFCMDQIESEIDNIRVALEWAIDSNQAELALRLACNHTLINFFRIRSLMKEGLQWLEKANNGFAWDDPRLTALHAKVLYAFGYLSTDPDDDNSIGFHSWRESADLYHSLGDETHRFLAIAEHVTSYFWYERGVEAHMRLMEECYQIGIQLDDPWMKALSTYVFGLKNTDDSSRDLLLRSIRMFEETGDRWFAGSPTREVGIHAFIRKDYATAEACYRQCLQISREMKDKEGVMWALTCLGDMAYFLGEFPQMESYFQQCQVTSQEIGFNHGMIWSIHHQGLAAQRLGQFQRAVTLYTESLVLAQAYNLPYRVGECLLGFAVICAEAGHWQPAISLLQAASPRSRCGEIENIGLLPNAELSRFNEMLPKTLSPATYEAACTAGKDMSIDEAVRLFQSIPLPTKGTK